MRAPATLRTTRFFSGRLFAGRSFAGSTGRALLGGLGLAALAFAAGCDKETKFVGVEPAFGAFTGGEEITILGNALPRVGMQVRFGLKEAQPVVVESDSKVKVLTPPGDKNTHVDVSVTFDDGRTFVLKNSFRYVDNQQRATADKFFDKAAK